ncbi:MAG TPA: tRNA uracil 4-sulfurtransferase ThiI [Candidatus Binataceae bacterium]|nr:tRNA uracil 4-sulfurtransferase ThiI [Candidatus Binataceae bacterium]
MSGGDKLFLIGRYHEIGLKGRNRWRFVEALKENLRMLCADLPLGAMRAEGRRLVVEITDANAVARIRERAERVFGLQNFSISRRTPLAIADIVAAAMVTVAEARAQHTTFRVSARRTEKRFALDSMAIERLVGAAIVQAYPLRVDLERPDLEVTIEIMPDGAYVAAGKLSGAGGLPVGVSGRGLVLLSGGIDSPVAAWRMMRRGLWLDFIHFHSYPLVSAASREKAEELAEHLTRFQAQVNLTLIPFAETQRAIVARAPTPLRVVLYRRFMLRIAAAVALHDGARALITGESLGQVASQTLDNMTVIAEVAALPVLRPLIGMDKNEIIEMARRLGTFETSIMPDQDCCSLFVPRHPETHAQLDQVRAAEAMLDVEGMVADAVARREIRRFSFPPSAGAHRFDDQVGEA